ncbi:MAG: hypothetical protein LBT49_00235, partial [Prevotellaceae bacterium]|nr:hypothetical protein [Prevotellaceae bacterium]
MKKLFLLLLCCPVALSAQNGVKISGFSVKPGTPSSTVTFTVSWSPLTNGKQWSDSVWVFVDYNDAGTMTRLPLSGATLTNSSWAAASVTMINGNPNGAWVVGNARTNNNFSATVQLVTNCGDAQSCVPAGLCVYAINYPPLGEYTAANVIKFTGTPPFVLEFVEGGGTTIPHEPAPHTYIYTFPAGKTLKLFS